MPRRRGCTSPCRLDPLPDDGRQASGREGHRRVRVRRHPDQRGAGALASHRLVLAGGAATSCWLGARARGKTHLASAIAASVIRAGARGRYFNTVDLVTQLEEETRIGKAGALAAQLRRHELVVLDELGYLPFAAFGWPVAVPPDQQALRADVGDHHHQPDVRRVAPACSGDPKMTTALSSIASPHHCDIVETRQRQLALQEPQLTPDRDRFALLAPPVGLRPPYVASSANDVPSVDARQRHKGGPFCMPIGGPRFDAYLHLSGVAVG